MTIRSHSLITRDYSPYNLILKLENSIVSLYNIQPSDGLQLVCYLFRGMLLKLKFSGFISYIIISPLGIELPLLLNVTNSQYNWLMQ